MALSDMTCCSIHIVLGSINNDGKRIYSLIDCNILLPSERRTNDYLHRVLSSIIDIYDIYWLNVWGIMTKHCWIYFREMYRYLCKHSVLSSIIDIYDIYWMYEEQWRNMTLNLTPGCILLFNVYVCMYVCIYIFTYIYIYIYNAYKKDVDKTQIAWSSLAQEIARQI